MKFKKFLFEGVKEDIIIEMNEMSEKELHEFGVWLYVNFFDMDEDNEDVSNDEFESITIEEIIEMLGDMSQEELEYIYEMSSAYDEDEEVDSHNDNIDESVSRRMTAKNRNKKKRKFMSNSKADMRRSKVSRKQANRKTKAKRKRYYRQNKVKSLAYAASRRKAISTGKHKVKLRRKA